MNNLDINDLPALFKQLAPKVAHYLPVLFTIALIGLYAYFALQITTYVQSEPSEQAKNEVRKSSQQIDIDDTAVESIRKLQAREVNVTSNIDPESSRNPFAEN